jgi:hypothetical protein
MSTVNVHIVFIQSIGRSSVDCCCTQGVTRSHNSKRTQYNDADVNIVVNLEMMIMNIHFCILMLYVLFIELHEKIDFLIDNIFVALALQSLSKGANYPVLLDNK